MTRRKKTPPPDADADALLDELLVDAHGDDEQLSVLHEAISDALALPTEARVMGQPTSLVAVEHGGNPRRGLVARCRGADGEEHVVGLADVHLPARARGREHLDAYRRWLGMEPAEIPEKP